MNLPEQIRTLCLQMARSDQALVLELVEGIMAATEPPAAAVRERQILRFPRRRDRPPVAKASLRT